ncbi:hypothetical protein Q8A73_012628 [Channa argus]|nr:hypothetical protein Q8A73_012628 [Channa argus]
MSGNASLLHLSSNSHGQLFECTTSKVTVVTFITFSITNILILLPIFAHVLYLGYQRWRKPHHISTSASAASSSDIFTYHIVVMEMIMILGCLSYCVGSFTDLKEMIVYGLAIFISTWSIKTYFHTLTCVAHYLAVVHPVTYLCLRNRSGVRIRNVCIGCILAQGS